jgi:tryptophanyl-tRNA synthetase
MAEHLNKALDPIRAKRQELEADMDKVKAVVDEGNARARDVARQTMEEVRLAVRI